MSYATKITVLLVVTSLLPLVASGLVAATISSEAVEEQTYGLQKLLAEQTASRINGWFEGVAGDLRRVGSFLPFERSEEAERAALLRVPFRQLSYLDAVALLDREGKALAPTVFLSPDATRLPADLQDRPRLTEADVSSFSHHVPLQHALRFGAAFGPPYVSGRKSARLVCAVRLDRMHGEGVLAAEISLEPLERMLGMAGQYKGRSLLVDGRHKVVVGLSGERTGDSLPYWPLGIETSPRKQSYRGSNGELMTGATGRVPLLGWSVLLEQPLATVLGKANQLRHYTLGWGLFCLLLAILGGIYLSRGVTRPVKELAAAALKMQRGDYAVTVPSSGRDELSQLATAFNEMAAAVHGAVTVIGEQKAELQRWNEELQQRVEERTREVHDALEQVIRSQKLGALGELGAGLAHELNNSLTGVMNLCQLLLLDLPRESDQRRTTEQILEQGRRIRDVVDNFQRFSRTPEGLVLNPVDMGEVCKQTLALVDRSLNAAKIQVDLQWPASMPRVQGNADELRQALLHLVQNAVRAMPDGGTLALLGKHVEGAVRISVVDSGVGIPADRLTRIFEPFYGEDKAKTHQPGLGLSVAHRIVTEHHGQIVVHSTPCEGSEFIISLPGLREELHLT